MVELTRITRRTLEEETRRMLNEAQRILSRIPVEELVETIREAREKR